MERRNFLKDLTLGSGMVLATGGYKGLGFPHIFKRFSNNLYEADILVYGGTSASVVACSQRCEVRRKVIVILPDKHLGGMTSSGLVFTDVGITTVIRPACPNV